MMMTGGRADAAEGRAPAASFVELVSLVRRGVEARLSHLLDEAVATMRPCGADAVAAIDAAGHASRLTSSRVEVQRWPTGVEPD